MNWHCLVVNLTDSDLSLEWEDAKKKFDFCLPCSFASTEQEANEAFSRGDIACMIIRSDKVTKDMLSVLEAFQAQVAPIPEFQAIIAEEPTPRFLVQVFEFGVEQILSFEGWQEEVVSLFKKISERLEDEDSAESKAIALQNSIRKSDHANIKKLGSELEDLGEYDYRVALLRGKAEEAQGNYSGAVAEYAKANNLNSMYRQASGTLGEALITTGKIDEGIAILEKLEKSNKRVAARKAQLSTAYLIKGDTEKAENFLKAAKDLDPEHMRVREADAQLLLRTGRVNEALKLLDGLQNVGPLFAAKLNDLGVQLSRAGKGKSALALYKKAHKIVRIELRYKISLNAALACRRMKQYDLARKYVERCAKEHGGSFEKLDKIRAAVIKESRGLNEKKAS